MARSRWFWIVLAIGLVLAAPALMRMGGAATPTPAETAPGAAATPGPTGAVPSTATAAPAAPNGSLPVGAVAAQVTAITDGDTIKVEIDDQEYKVRYILMNTPEKNETFGSEATAANRALVADKTVYLVKDVSETDRYGRLLRYVYLPDGTFVNAELVRQGLAQVATFPPDVSKEAEIRAAQQEAMDAGRGLWALQATE